MDIKFSIIIPTLNSQSTLKNCLRSIVNQFYKNWEIIVIDSSKGNLCKNICDQFNLGKKLLYFRSNVKKGLAYDRFQGIHKASGDFISFLDSDDVWMKKKLYNQYKLIKKKNPKFLCSNYILKVGKNFFYSKGKLDCFDLNYLFKNRPISNSSATVDASIMKKVSSRFHKNIMAEDLLWWTIILRSHTKRCYVVKSYDVQNILMSSSRSTMFIKNYLDIYQIYRYYHKMSHLKIFFYFSCLIVTTFAKNNFKLKNLYEKKNLFFYR
jgi:teichuronic acid biosynthesis glycosyltransferase TuaG